MSKKRSLPRLDAKIERSAQYPDINEFLKDTQYEFQSSNYLDNQASARLTLLLERGDSVSLTDSVTVAGFSKSFYLTTSHFYGYNPDVESLERVVLALPTFPGFSQEFTRTNTDFRFVTLSSTETSIGDSVKNYRLTFSRRGLAQLISYVFSTTAELAFDYFSVATSAGQSYSAEALLTYVVSNLYSVSIPLSFTYFYFNSTRPAFSISTALTLKDLLSYLKEDFRPEDAFFRLLPNSDTFQVDIQVKRPVVITVKVEVGGKTFQQDVTVYGSAGVQQIPIVAGYDEFFILLAKQVYIDSIPTVTASYTYKPIGYVLDLVEPITLGYYVDPTTPSPLTVQSWFFGNYPRAVDSVADSGRLYLEATLTAKTPLLFASVHFRFDNATTTAIDKVVPVSGGGISDAAYRNEMAELTVMLTEDPIGSPTQHTALVASLSNGNKVLLNTRYGLGLPTQRRRRRFTRLVTNVNQVDFATDSVAALTPAVAVNTRSRVIITEDTKQKLYVYKVRVVWPDYTTGSVLWPCLTTTRICISFLDQLTRTIAKGEITKTNTTVYSPAQVWTNPFRVSRPEAGFTAEYKRWFPKYVNLRVNGSATVAPKAPGFSASLLASSITANVFAADLSKVVEVPVKLSKQQVYLSSGLASATGFLLSVDTQFFTRLFFKKFVNRREQYGYLLDQAVVAVSLKDGKTVKFYTNSHPQPYLAVFDSLGSTDADVAFYDSFISRFLSQEAISLMVRQIVGDYSSKSINATLYLVTGLHQVLDSNKQVLYYEVRYDQDYKMIPGIVFSIAGAWK